MTVGRSGCRPPLFSPNETPLREPGRFSNVPGSSSALGGPLLFSVESLEIGVESLEIGGRSSACGAICRVSLVAWSVIGGSYDAVAGGRSLRLPPKAIRTPSTHRFPRVRRRQSACRPASPKRGTQNLAAGRLSPSELTDASGRSESARLRRRPCGGACGRHETVRGPTPRPPPLLMRVGSPNAGEGTRRGGGLGVVGGGVARAFAGASGWQPAAAALNRCRLPLCAAVVGCGRVSGRRPPLICTVGVARRAALPVRVVVGCGGRQGGAANWGTLGRAGSGSSPAPRCSLLVGGYRCGSA
jgi:hypothetical protein